MRVLLKEKRKLKKLSVSAMADILGISKSFYYKIEKGTRNPTITLATKICEIINIKLEEIFFDTNLDITSNRDDADCKKAG